MQDVQLLHLKDSPVSIDRYTHGTETSCDETSRESSPPGPPVTDVVMETAQVETYPGSHDIHPRYSTPKQDIQHNGFHQSIQHNGAPIHVTPLDSIPEKAKAHPFPLGGRSDVRSKSSPMLRGTRFSSEVSNAIHIINVYIYSLHG